MTDLATSSGWRSDGADQDAVRPTADRLKSIARA
jgi:hypothetical protein